MRESEGEANAELLFERLFGQEHHAFWLDSAERWLDQIDPTIRETLAPAPPTNPTPPNTNEDPPNGQVTFRVGRGREQYLADIARCHSALAAGESYEICLTGGVQSLETDSQLAPTIPVDAMPGAAGR